MYPNSNADWFNHFRCAGLDPLRLFSGEVTDSDSGSVYMRLERTPVALLRPVSCLVFLTFRIRKAKQIKIAGNNLNLIFNSVFNILLE